MKADAGEWVAKAEGDFYDAQRGIRARKHPNYDGVCFHCQQCIEKYLKGRLVEKGIDFPKTHDLAKLLDLLGDTEPAWKGWRPDLDVLTDYAVSFRYPQENATQEEAKQAFKLCCNLRTQIRAAFGLRDGKSGGGKKR